MQEGFKKENIKRNYSNQVAQNKLIKIKKKRVLKRFTGKIYNIIESIKDNIEKKKLGNLEYYDIILKRQDGTFIGLKDITNTTQDRIKGISVYYLVDSHFNTKRVKNKIRQIILTEITLEMLKDPAREDKTKVFVNMNLSRDNISYPIMDSIYYVGTVSLNQKGLLQNKIVNRNLKLIENYINTKKDNNTYII